MNQIHTYINGIGVVSPQKPMQSAGFLAEPISYQSNQLKCPDPGYREFIPPELIRRMSRIIRMGVTASKMCLQDARKVTMNEDGDLCVPDAIITGTGFGCLEDTEKFLTSMIVNHEQMLSPAPFIQSTHNTVAGQIALLLKSHGYNMTYSHRGNSFESALTDALVQLNLGMVENVLAGGFDELTANAFMIMSRFGFWKRKPIDSLHLSEDRQRGTIAGEGAAFFYLDKNKLTETYAGLKGVKIFNAPASEPEMKQILTSFLHLHDASETDVDFLLLGYSGDPGSDTFYDTLRDCFDHNPATGYFKHLCGEYPTSNAFATALAAMMLKNQLVPGVLKTHPETDISQINNLLIYNHYHKKNHAFILLQMV